MAGVARRLMGGQSRRCDAGLGLQSRPRPIVKTDPSIRKPSLLQKTQLHGYFTGQDPFADGSKHRDASALSNRVSPARRILARDGCLVQERSPK
jgi:hypothetical protein